MYSLSSQQIPVCFDRKLFRASSKNCTGFLSMHTTPDYWGRGRKPSYSAKRGSAVYRNNRSRCRRSKSVPRNSKFIHWMVKQVRGHKWSFDTCVGWARRHKQFPTEQIPCTKTLYNLLWRGELPITLFELPEILERKQHGKPRISKHLNGKSIENRPDEVNHRNTFGHWESDTVLGRKCKGEGAAFTIVERLTGCYFMLRIEEKTTAAIAFAMEQLRLEFGEQFAEVFRSITTDNGCEFAAFSDMEAYGTDVYFAHLYSSWKRPVNERSNRMLRRFLPKGTSMNSYSNEQMIMFADEINAMPRKRLGYRTAEELFDEQLDIIYST